MKETFANSVSSKVQRFLYATKAQRDFLFCFNTKPVRAFPDGGGYDEIVLPMAFARDDEGISPFRAIGADFVTDMPEQQHKCHSANPTKHHFLDSLAGSLIDSKISIPVDQSVLAVERQRPILRVHQISTLENIQWKLGPWTSTNRLIQA